MSTENYVERVGRYIESVPGGIGGLDVEEVLPGRNSLYRFDFCGRSYFYKDFGEEKTLRLEREAEAYKILEELDFDLPKSYCSFESGFFLTEEFGEDSRDLGGMRWEGELVFDREGLVDALVMKFLVSDCDITPDNFVVDYATGSMTAIDFESSGKPFMYGIYEQHLNTFEGAYGFSISMEEIYERSCFLLEDNGIEDYPGFLEFNKFSGGFDGFYSIFEGV